LSIRTPLHRIGDGAGVADVGDAGVVSERHRLVVALLLAIQRGQREVVAQVAGVAAYIELATVAIVVAAGLGRATDDLIGIGHVLELGILDVLLGHVRHRREFQGMVVGDLPVDLGHPARDVVLGPLSAVGGATRAREDADLVLLGDLAAGIYEQAVLDEAAAGVDAIAPRAGLDLV